MKKLLLFCAGLCWLNIASADAKTLSLYTYVTVTNNTNENLTIKPSLTTSDVSFKDWDGSEQTLKPYETKKVLRFSRNQNIKAQQVYQFNLLASNPTYPGNDVKMTLTETGKNTFGSELKNELSLPDNRSYSILKKDGLEKYPATFWGHDYEIFARTWLPSGALYNDFQFVINKIDHVTSNTNNNSALSVLSYNTQLMPFYANIADDLNNREIRSQDIPKNITNYDVVILEELFDHDLRNTVIEKMQAYYPYHTKVVGYNTSNILTGGVMIFSKWPINKEDQIIYQTSAGMDAYAAKGAVYAEILKNGKIYHIVGTHLQADGDEKDVRVRQHQLSEMANFIERLDIPVNQPLIFGGDFNIDEKGKELQTLLTTLHVNLVSNIGHPYSYDADIDTMALGKGGSRIDYVFYSNLHTQPKIANNRVYVLRDLENEKMWPKFDLSDHFPIAGYFDFST